ncbi:hypothetical protein U3516DRAFT_608985, partial [Neocallimastix sp. 'constans']
MSFDIHIEKDFKKINNDNKNLQSPKFTSKNLEYLEDDKFSTPTRINKEINKNEPSAPKKKKGKLFFNSINDKRNDLYNIYGNDDNSLLPSSPTISIQSLKYKKEKEKEKEKEKNNSIPSSSISNSQKYLQQNNIPPPLVKPNLAAFNRAIKKTKLIYSNSANIKNNVIYDNDYSKDTNNNENFSDTDSYDSFDSLTNSGDNNSFLFFNSSENNEKYKLQNNKILNSLDTELNNIYEKKNLFSLNNNSKAITKKNNQRHLNFFSENLSKKNIDFNLNFKDEISNDISDNFNLLKKSISPFFHSHDHNIFRKDSSPNFSVKSIFEYEDFKNINKNDNNNVYNFFSIDNNDNLRRTNKKIVQNIYLNIENNDNTILNTKKKDENIFSKKRNYQLPNKLWKIIFNYLNYKEILSMSSISKQINLLIEKLDIWKKIDIRTFPYNNIKNEKKFLKELLKSKYSIKIETLIFNSDKELLTPEIMSLLIKNCKSLKSLIMEKTAITVKHFENNLGKGESINSLKCLNINNCSNINFVAFKYLICGCPNLNKLECSNINLRSSEFCIIRELSDLQFLNISNNKYLCNLDIKAIYNKENKIKYLDISNCGSLTDRAISFILKNAQNLKIIKINGSDIRITQKSFHLLSESKIQTIEYNNRIK